MDEQIDIRYGCSGRQCVTDPSGGIRDVDTSGRSIGFIADALPKVCICFHSGWIDYTFDNYYLSKEIKKTTQRSTGSGWWTTGISSGMYF